MKTSKVCRVAKHTPSFPFHKLVLVATLLMQHTPDSKRDSHLWLSGRAQPQIPKPGDSLFI